MKISIKIQEIDNGFIVKLYDEDGPASHDEELFYEKFDEVLEKIKGWKKEAEKTKET